MGRFGQKTIARQAVLSALVLFALVLQSFLAASAPAPAVPLQGDIGRQTCTLDVSGPASPGKNSIGHHGLCCILACAGAVFGYVGTASSNPAFPERTAALLHYSLAHEPPARAPLKHYFAARGPPAIV